MLIMRECRYSSSCFIWRHQERNSETTTIHIRFIFFFFLFILLFLLLFLLFNVNSLFFTYPSAVSVFDLSFFLFFRSLNN
jgi:hypothetical protein